MKKQLLIFCMAFSLVSQAQNQVLTGYWHNWNDASAPYLALNEIDSQYDIICISFIVPENGTTYQMAFSPESATPSEFAADIQLLQSQDKKVLFSIGGATAPVHVSSEQEKSVFVNTILDIIQTYQPDGLDIDFEGASLSVSGGTISEPVDQSVLLIIDAFREIMESFHQTYGRKMMLTAAPETAFVQGGQSAYGGIWGAYLPVLDALRDSLDYLQVQLYNSGSMYGIDGNVYVQGTTDFILSQTEALISGFNTSGGAFEGFPQEKICIGLPACPMAAGGGFISADSLEAAVNYLIGNGPQPGSYSLQNAGSYPAIGGLMTWSINWDATPGCNATYEFANTYSQIFELSTATRDYNASEIALFPVPADDFLYLKTNGISSKKVQFSLFDSSGKLLKSIQVLNSGNMFRIETGNLSSGLYFIQSELGTQKFTK
ncbi:MAG: T9SS type A sorting domain-containing protein [Bacteroidetes bacterium]|nr:T9SS type A sorting domain-containing protein [Bacteroidota bacterium]